MKKSPQITFMNKEGKKKKNACKKEFFIKKKRNIRDIKNASCVVSSLLK